jgi:hypothetical protein
MASPILAKSAGAAKIVLPINDIIDRPRQQSLRLLPAMPEPANFRCSGPILASSGRNVQAVSFRPKI